MSRPRALALVLATLVLLVWCALRLDIGSDITHFMPDGSRSELAGVSARLTDSSFTRTMVFSVGAPQLDAAVEAARELAEVLRAHPEIAWVRQAVDEAQLRELYDIYFPRRHYFLSDDPEREIPELLSDAALREKARSLKRRLSSPAATLLEPLAASDPIGSFEALVGRVRAGGPALRVERGQFVTRDGGHAVLLAGTHHSAFDTAAQGPLVDDLAAEWSAIAARGPGLELEVSAANRFAVSAERSIKGDVYLIGACSFLGVATLFLLLVGSLRGFLIVSLPPLVGILVATSLGLLVFGELDGLTMAFGGSLMGIAVDYSNHLLIHYRLGLGERPEQTVRRIRPSLALGALTTVASFGGLAITAFPAFREMSFFAAVGVTTALLVTLFVLPALLPYAPPLPRRSAQVAAELGRLLGRLGRRRRPWLVPLALAGLAAVALPALRWNDDMSRLARLDPDLVEEDRRVRARVASLDSGRFVIGLADDAAAAVALSDAVHTRLARAAALGHLAGSRGLHGLLWSEELQRRNEAALRAQPDLAARVDAAFASEGFRAGAFDAFQRALAEPAAAPLTLADLQQSPLADLLVPFVFPLGEDVAVVSYLREVRSVPGIREALDGLPGVHLLDQGGFVNEIYREFRETTLRQMLVGALLVLLMLAVRYRAPRPVLAAFLPSAVVALGVLAVLALAGVALNLFHVMSLIMVMGMGVDYGVFLVDGAGRGEPSGATLLSLLMSCLTTAFVFGTLALSEQPALRAIGVTTGIGILLSFLLAPLVLASLGLSGERRE